MNTIVEGLLIGLGLWVFWLLIRKPKPGAPTSKEIVGDVADTTVRTGVGVLGCLVWAAGWGIVALVIYGLAVMLFE